MKPTGWCDNHKFPTKLLTQFTPIINFKHKPLEHFAGAHRGHLGNWKTDLRSLAQNRSMSILGGVCPPAPINIAANITKPIAVQHLHEVKCHSSTYQGRCQQQLQLPALATCSCWEPPTTPPAVNPTSTPIPAPGRMDATQRRPQRQKFAENIMKCGQPRLNWATSSRELRRWRCSEIARVRPRLVNSKPPKMLFHVIKHLSISEQYTC